MARNFSLSNFGESAAGSNFEFTSKSHSVGPRSLNISVRKKKMRELRGKIRHLPRGSSIIQDSSPRKNSIENTTLRHNK